MAPILLAITLPLAASDAVDKAIAYLSAQTPRWSAENHCFSCHNNGDGARTLFAASEYGYKISTHAVSDSLRWLGNPGAWDHDPGKGGFNDRKLARIQFASALAEAWRSHYLNDRKPLLDAAESLAREQDHGGSWIVDTGGLPGAPATYGSVLATYMARRTLQIADVNRFAAAIGRANSFLRAVAPANTLDRATVLLALPQTAPVHVAPLFAGQTREGGWGPQAGAPPEPFDTAIVLVALQGAAAAEGSAPSMIRARAFLTSTQLRDGSWPETTRPAGAESYAERVSTTAWAAYALMVTDPKGH